MACKFCGFVRSLIGMTTQVSENNLLHGIGYALHNAGQDGNLDNATFDEHTVPFHQHWKRGTLPDPGGAIYAYDTLALMEFYPINRFGLVQSPPLVLQGPQQWALPSATIYELPQPTGQIMLQALDDPNADNGS